MRGRRLDRSEILNPGLLRHQITWRKRNVVGQDSLGQDKEEWTDVMRCKAQVRAISGSQEYRADQQYWAEAKYEVMQHYYPGAQAEMQIAWLIDNEWRYLDVLGIDDPAGTGRYQLIACRDFEQ